MKARLLDGLRGIDFTGLGDDYVAPIGPPAPDNSAITPGYVGPTELMQSGYTPDQSMNFAFNAGLYNAGLYQQPVVTPVSPSKTPYAGSFLDILTSGATDLAQGTAEAFGYKPQAISPLSIATPPQGGSSGFWDTLVSIPSVVTKDLESVVSNLPIQSNQNSVNSNQRGQTAAPKTTGAPAINRVPVNPATPRVQKPPTTFTQDFNSVVNGILALVTPFAAAKQAKQQQQATRGAQGAAGRKGAGGSAGGTGGGTSTQTYVLVGVGILAVGILAYMVTKD